jgi:hypothetical protein
LKQHDDFLTCNSTVHKDINGVVSVIMQGISVYSVFLYLRLCDIFVVSPLHLWFLNLVFMDPCIVDDSVEIPTRCSFVIEFIIPKFIEGSTCFERHTAHHQEL